MRTLLAIGVVLALLAGSHLSPATADEPKAKPPELTVKLGTIPDIKMAKRPAVDEGLTKRIKGMIADLAKLNSDIVGLSPGMDGPVFAPVSDKSYVANLFTDDQEKRWQVLRDLIALGPDALPHLLDALDDKTPTEIVIASFPSSFGGMWHCSELDINPVNPAEATVYKAREEARQKARDGVVGGEEDVPLLKSYTVTVGDVCFVAVGQIVGREYSAVRRKGTSIIHISSPVHDAKLCADVRAAWGGEEPAKKLFDSLLADYATESAFNGKVTNGWYFGSHRQCEAATRLLYYYPKESAKLIAGRLEKLDVGKDDSLLRAVACGVWTEHFLKGVSWCDQSDVRAALAGVFKRAECPRDVLAALPAIRNAKLLLERLAPLVAWLPAAETSMYGDGHFMLTALAERAPEAAKGVFQKYLKGAGHQRHQTVCLVLESVKVPWDVEVLGPLLTDTREGYRSYCEVPGKEEKWLRTRICDEAALILSANHPELKFTLAGTHADLDKQVSVIREQSTRKR